MIEAVRGRNLFRGRRTRFVTVPVMIGEKIGQNFQHFLSLTFHHHFIFQQVSFKSLYEDSSLRFLLFFLI
jgi:hypothetical protein